MLDATPIAADEIDDLPGDLTSDQPNGRHPEPPLTPVTVDRCRKPHRLPSLSTPGRLSPPLQSTSTERRSQMNPQAIDDTGGEPVGVCYGIIANNLPPASEVVALYKSNNIQRMRLYFPTADALDALRGSGIQLTLGIDNNNLQVLAADQSSAATWIQTYVKAYWPDVAFRYISVGNEAIPSIFADYVLPAMKNIRAALDAAGLNTIKVSTSVFMGVLGKSYPPSTGEFAADAVAYMAPIVKFLADNQSPLLANVYTYHSYIGNPKDISLEYALFTSNGTVVKDGALGYQNLFDATLDAVYSALQKAGVPDVEVVVSETGWPTDGGFAATVDNARTFNTNLIKHVKGGTPKRPGKPIEAYIFAMFDENQKEPVGQENHYGLFHSDKQPAYTIVF